LRIANIELKEVPEPPVGPGEVKIQVEAAGICGSDLHILHGDIQIPMRPPFVIGHEFAGVVVEVGEGVRRWETGARVTAENSRSVCGHCRYCATGSYNLCPERLAVGYAFDGAFARYCVVPEERVHRLPENVDFVSGALSDPSACAYHAVQDLTGIDAGDVVLITGPGPMGLFCLQYVKANGGTVILTGLPRDRPRLELGKRLGGPLMQPRAASRRRKCSANCQLPGGRRQSNRLRHIFGEGERDESRRCESEHYPRGGAQANGGKPIEGIATELYTKALVLDDGKTKVALVTADVILLGKDVVAEARGRIEATTGLPGANVMFAASHTHSGAVTTMRDRWSSIEPDHAYVDQLVAKMAGAVREANSRLVEARIGAGEGYAAASINRWVSTPDGAKWAPNPDGPVDNTVSVLRVDGADGRPLAALVNYAAHASVMRWGKVIAADYPGFLQAVMEKVYDHQITVLFANGASGDTKIAWLVKREDGSDDFGYGGVEDARRWGTLLAGEAIKVLEQTPTGEVNELQVSSTEVSLPLLPHPSPEEVERQLAEKREKGQDAMWEERTLASLRAGTAPTAIVGEVQFLRIGPDIALVAVPGELFAEVGLKMKESLAVRYPFLVGYANGYVGYLPSAASCREDGEKPRYDWHKFFWYPSNFTEEVEPVLLAAVRELAAPGG